ncbi:TAXI family TRAP transporter solute-binding subunit [Methylobacterium sp. WSM2598]|uniref:TAXI family TRAP transporter solute-binding subunit n=1 Tax=Methylobacterium sp. WSM2598 TaxID=398261 RepID=UPI00037452DE|nr:TAXI family TRAP transporter solute-binding subunit [Methylobacterium sp. WSM2598]
MGTTVRWLVVAAGLCLVAGLAVAAWRHLSKPAILSVAVGPAEFDDAVLIAAWSRALTQGGAPARLSVIPTSGPTEALARLAEGKAQLAVVRGDGAVSEKVRAVAILHKDPVVIVALSKTRIAGFADLRGRVLGVVGPPNANDQIVATLRNHYAVSVDARTVPPSAIEISDAIRSRKVDALLFTVPATRGARMREKWAAVRRASRRELAFLEISEAEAIAAATPVYEATEIAAGQFGGSPTLPAESLTTLEVATFLVADREVSNDVITQLTRHLFDNRQKLTPDAPLAALVEAASTDKDAVIPVHPGARAFYDSEETTLMERYGDWLFYGPMILGLLGSGLAAILRFLGVPRVQDAPTILSRAHEMISSIARASTLSDLERIRSRLDEAVATIASQAARGRLEEHQAAVIHLAVDYVDQALTKREEALRSARRAEAAGDVALQRREPLRTGREAGLPT